MSERLSTQSFKTWFVAIMMILLSGGHLIAQVATIGAGVNAGSTGSNAGPAYRSSAASAFDFSQHVYLYTAAELAAAGINPGDNITSVAWNKSNAFGTAATNLSSIWKVYIQNTSVVPGATWSSSSFATQVASATLAYNNTAQVITTATGFITLTFSSPFIYTGGNLMIGSDWNCSIFAGSPTTGGFAWRSDNISNVTFGGSNSAATMTMGLQTVRPQIQLGYTAGAPCAGQPTPGNTLASSTTVCAGSAVSLSLQNSTSGSGVSFQWQESDDNSSWNNFGTSSPSATFTLGTTPKYFQCIVTCSGDPNPGISNSVLVSINTTPFPVDFASTTFPPNCFSETDVASNYLDRSTSNGFGAVGTGSARWNFYNASSNTVLTLTSPTLSAGVDPNTNLNFDVAGATYNGGEVDTIHVEESSDGGATWTIIATLTNQVGGVLNTLGATTTSNFVPTAAQWSSLSFPVTAGSNRFRLRGVSNFGNSVYVDNLNLFTPPPCVEPPTAGNATASITQFCNTSLADVTLSLSGNSSGIGQTYQWQYSFDGSDYFDIVGATTATYLATGNSASTYFQCNVTCGSTTVPSAPVFVEAVTPPVAGVISGPSSGFASQANSYSTAGESGNLQWLARLQPATAWSVISGATTNPQNVFFGAIGTYDIRLIASVPGCNTDSSNIISTTITIQNDNVCNAVPVNIGVNGPFTNNGATVEPGEAQAPNTNCNGNGSWCDGSSGLISNTVWFTFTVPTGGSGRYGFAVPGWDSQVAVWKASACSDLTSGLGTLWAANDDSASSPFNAYALGFCLEEGETVYIQVDGYGSTTNSAFALRIDDFGPANASFTGLPSTICANAASVSLTGAVAGGTFSGSGVTGSSFDPAAAGAGVHTITYTLSGLDSCYSSSQSVTVEAPTFTYYADVDNDTYGDASASILSCSASAPSGYVVDATDCNDANPSINPGASEVCNSIDDNCDGLTDEGFDLDGDTYTTCEGDCDDNNAAVYPGATEVCNNIDDDCNTLVDDGLTFVTYYADVDGDTYGDASSSVSTCNGAPVGYVSGNTDCDDNNAAVNPAATEVCNSIDDDCDGLTDENILVAGAISGPAVQCLPVATGSATFSIAPVADASTYTWSVPAGMVIVTGQGTTSIFVSWSPASISAGVIGNLSVVPSNACGSGVASSVAVDINYTKPVMPNSISGPVKVCPGDVVTYSTSLVARATSFVWTLPAGMSIVGGAGTNVISVSVSGAYTGGVISVSAANSCGVGAARNRALSLNVPPASASISGQASGVCGATGVVYSCASVVGATTYNWTVPAGASIVSGNGTNTITVDFTGSYGGGNISVQSANGCGNGGTRNLSVTGAPGLPGVISGDQTICPGQANVPYSVATVAGASTYNWTVPGIASIASGQGTKDIFVNWGTNPTVGQSVTVSATNGCGTGAIRSLNGIAIDLGNCIRVGETGAATALNVYPNPATELATIVFNGTEGADFNLNMVDIAGRVIMTERGTAVAGMNQRNVVVSEMASGVYFINIQINGVSEQIRVMID